MLKKHPSGHPNYFVRNFLKWQSQVYNWIFHLHIIPMTLHKDIMPYFDKFIHVYDWNRSIWRSPLKIWTPNNFMMVNFGHPVSKSWLIDTKVYRVAGRRIWCSATVAESGRAEIWWLLHWDRHFKILVKTPVAIWCIVWLSLKNMTINKLQAVLVSRAWS